MAVVVGVAVAVTCVAVAVTCVVVAAACVVVAAACVGLEVEVCCAEGVARSESVSPPPHARVEISTANMQRQRNLDNVLIRLQ